MKAFIVLIVGAAVALTSVSAIAGGKRSKKPEGYNNYTLSQRKPEVRGFLFRPGGYRYDYEYEPFLRQNGPYGNFPQFDPRNFWERVQGDPRGNANSPSAF
ncbi:MAG: hypothetical protein HC850_14865 [Rhodomicrobium sp.]|nr:hypothetical protein [Rhodomicrobium sp.]